MKDKVLYAFINKYKNYRSKHWLSNIYQCNYAFVGIGNHSIMNLYPVLQYLQVPIKYICCRSNDKLLLIENKYRGIKATTSLDKILDDDDVKGVFVSASPRSHFSISSKVLNRGKSLFVEKPICYTSEELSELYGVAKRHGVKVAMVGMQKRYSPATRLLNERLKDNELISYNYRYTTGLYPEGDALVELFIHPLDYVTYLFGKAKIIGNRCIKTDNGGITYLIILQHEKITGVLELSSAYTWINAQETLLINTKKGSYSLNQMEELTFQAKPGIFCGIPVEKVLSDNKTEAHFYERNNFIPSLVNNQIYSQGYYSEIKAFLDANERNEKSKSSISDLFQTYSLIGELNKD